MFDDLIGFLDDRSNLVEGLRNIGGRFGYSGGVERRVSLIMI